MTVQTIPFWNSFKNNKKKFFLHISLSNWNQIRWLGRPLCPDSALFIKLILSLLCDMIHYSPGHSQQNILNCYHKGIHIIIKKYSDKLCHSSRGRMVLKRPKYPKTFPCFWVIMHWGLFFTTHVFECHYLCFSPIVCFKHSSAKVL